MRRDIASKPEAVFHRLHRIMQLGDSIFWRHASEAAVDITARQLMLLAAIAERDGLSQTVLTRATNIDRSTTADMIRRLCKSGLVRRNRSKQDARAYEVRLTEQGRKVLGMAAPALARAERELLAALSKDQREVFIVLLDAVVAYHGGTRKSI